METISHELTLRQIQLATLDILKQIISICDDQGLTYYLAYGSLIGAVRHHGFIPWDDDLDICMPRPDYNKFLAYFDDEGHDTGTLKAIHNKTGHLLPFLITRISDTSYQEIGEFGDEIPEMGTFIDVYPLDGVGNDSETAEKQKKTVDYLTKQYLRAADFDIYNKNASTVKKTLKRMRTLFLKKPQYYWQKIMQQSTEEQYRESDFISCQVWIPVITRFHSKKDYGTGQITEFEGLRVRIPNNPDAILRKQYGDYMKLPPKEERISHHFYSIVPRA